MFPRLGMEPMEEQGIWEHLYFKDNYLQLRVVLLTSHHPNQALFAGAENRWQQSVAPDLPLLRPEVSRQPQDQIGAMA